MRFISWCATLHKKTENNEELFKKTQIDMMRLLWKYHMTKSNAPTWPFTVTTLKTELFNSKLSWDNSPLFKKLSSYFTVI